METSSDARRCSRSASSRAAPEPPRRARPLQRALRSYGGEILCSDPRARRCQQLLDLEVRERDERNIRPALDADEARAPLREELPVEAVQPLELEEPVEAQEHYTQRAQSERRALVGTQRLCEHCEVQRELLNVPLPPPLDRLDDQELHQAVRRISTSSHRREGPTLARRRGDEVQEAA